MQSPEVEGEDAGEEGPAGAGAKKQPAPGSEASWAPGRTQTVTWTGLGGDRLLLLGSAANLRPAGF